MFCLRWARPFPRTGCALCARANVVRCDCEVNCSHRCSSVQAKRPHHNEHSTATIVVQAFSLGLTIGYASRWAGTPTFWRLRMAAAMLPKSVPTTTVKAIQKISCGTSTVWRYLVQKLVSGNPGGKAS